MSCKLCSMAYVKNGKDALLYKDAFCYIVENGNKGFDGVEYNKRISLNLRRHIADPDTATKYRAFIKLATYVMSNFKTPFFIVRTMGTHPDHFHIHAYI